MLRFKWLLLLFVGLLGVGLANLYENGKRAVPVVEKAVVPAKDGPIELILAKHFLCGVKEQEHKKIADQTVEQVLGGYKGWEIVSIHEKKIELAQEVNDISPQCKQNGYFGLSADSVFTLFDGLPADKKVIQTFYQINTAKMEASLPKEELEQLKKGIKVNDVAEYNSILSTYGEFQASDVEVFGH